MMLIPPSLIRLHVDSADPGISLWLPLIAAWPFLLLIAILALPLLVLGFLILWWKGLGRTAVFAVLDLFRLLCSLKGLEVSVQQPSQRVFVSIH